MSEYSFLGGVLPFEVKLLRKAAPKTDLTSFNNALKIAVALIRNEHNKDDLIAEVLKSEALSDELECVVNGLHTILRYALRAPEQVLKPELLKEDLAQLKIPVETISAICGTLYGPERHRLDDCAISSRPRPQTLECFRWRVDVSISTSVLSRVLEPTIMIELTLNGGVQKTIEVPIKAFHLLRFNVAKVLKEMEGLEERNILKMLE